MRSLLCLFLASTVLVAVRGAAAEPSPAAHRELRLSWVRSASAASCPDVGHVEADVERRLGWSPFVRATGSSEAIEATVTRDNDVWRAAIELRAADGSSQGSRKVESAASTCASLAAAAGLAIALMIEPLLPLQAPAGAATTNTEVPATNTPPSATPVATAPSPQPSAVANDTEEAGSTRSVGSMPNLALSLGVLAVARVLPEFSLGPTLTGSVRLVDGVYLVASGSLLPEQHVRAADTDVGFGMTLATLGGCYRVQLVDTWSVSGCASLLLGSMQVIVRNPVPLEPGSRPWWAGSAGLRLGWNVGNFETSLGIDALGHFRRQSYVVDRLPSAEEMPALFVEPGLAAAGSLLAGVRY